jgi:hypothetical protein
LLVRHAGTSGYANRREAHLSRWFNKASHLLEAAADTAICAVLLRPIAGTPGYATRREAFLSRWCNKASHLLEAVGLLGKGKSASIHMLLNKLLGMRVEMQGQLFSYFSAIMDKVGLLLLLLLL